VCSGGGGIEEEGTGGMISVGLNKKVFGKGDGNGEGKPEG